MKRLLQLGIFLFLAVQLPAQTKLEIFPSWANGGAPIHNLSVSIFGTEVTRNNGPLTTTIPASAKLVVLKLSAPETESEPSIACTITIPWGNYAAFSSAHMAIEIKSTGKLAGKSGTYRLNIQEQGTF